MSAATENGINNIVKYVISFQDAKEEDRALIEKFNSSQWRNILSRDSARIDEALNVLALDSNEKNTLGYLNLLAFKAATEYKNHNAYVEQATKLCRYGKAEHLAAEPLKLALITRHLRTSLQLIDNYARGVLGLRSAVQKLHAMNAFLLTPTHVDFVLVCIKAQMYEVAYTELAEQPLLKIDPMVNGLKPVDYLSFFYYLGTVCIAKRDYVKAIESMQVVLTCPSSILSAVQIEAYKKFIILSLLLHSEIIALPANLVNLRLMEELKKVTTAYVALARGFTAHVETGVKTLVQTIQSNFQRYERDKNVGIIKRLVDALNKRNIKRLTNTYLRLSLSDIATRANLESPARAEEFVREMIAEGSLHAKINAQDGMLSFLEDDEEYDTITMANKLNGKIQQVAFLSQQMHALNGKLQVDPRYVKQTMQPPSKDKSKGGRPRSAVDGMDDDDYEMVAAMQASLQTM